MRAFAILLLLGLGSAGLAAKSLPTSVTYQLGGTMSAPYRLSADLVQNTVSEAKSAPGDLPGAPAARNDPPIVSKVALTPKETLAIRRAAETVWRYGADTNDSHYWPPSGPVTAYRKWQRDTDNGKKTGIGCSPCARV